ncbi:MAG: hypothetical protein HY873_07795 [Chloroflexi bacterium]|nr:hypothetical protein [Chloroflexota bacterium]
MDRAARVLTSVGFVAGLLLLLANDFVLKQAYPGVLTGKLSDFAGLFIFPMFWSALFPRRTREIYLATALGFVWWKSPLSQGAIDGWNAGGIFEIGRVVDYTDLVALVVLPISHTCLRISEAGATGGLRLRVAPIVFGFAAFSFAATSFLGEPPRLKYEFAPDDPAAVLPIDFDAGEIHIRLDASGHAHGDVIGRSGARPAVPGSIDVLLDNDCRLARIKAQYRAIRVVALDASGACGKASTRKSLFAMVRDELVPRLERKLPALPIPDDSGKEFYTYPDGEVPSLVLDGSLEDFAERVDSRPLFGHEYHDGVYYLNAALACNGRFRITVEPDGEHVRVIGIGYERPCWLGNDQAELARWFKTFLGAEEDVFGPPVAYPTCVAPEPADEPTVVSPPSVRSLVPTCTASQRTPVP